MGLRDGTPCALYLLHLLVEDLLTLALELPLHEGVGETRHVVPDVYHMQLRAALASEICSRLGRPPRVLGAVGGKQDLRRKHAHLALLLRSGAVHPCSNTTNPPRRPAVRPIRCPRPPVRGT